MTIVFPTCQGTSGSQALCEGALAQTRERRKQLERCPQLSRQGGGRAVTPTIPPCCVFPTQEKKKAIQEEEERDHALQAKASLTIPLVPETEDDRRLAALLKFHTLDCAWGGRWAQGAGRREMGVFSHKWARAGQGRGWPSTSFLPFPPCPQRTRTSRNSSGRRSAAAPGSPAPQDLVTAAAKLAAF